MNDELLNTMNELIVSLNVTGKGSTAEYFMSLKKKISTIKNPAKLKVILND